MIHTLIKISFLLLVVVLMLSLSPSDPVSAAGVINVNTFDDELNEDDDCSLREAIQTANGTLVAACSATDPGPGATINLQAGTYILTLTGRNDNLNQSGDLDLRRNMTLSGLGVGTTIIDGNASDRVFHLVVYGISVSISQLTIRNGDVNAGLEGGAGILVGYGTALDLSFCRVTENRAPSSLGGGIDNYQGNVTITNCTIDFNTASEGGGVYNDNILFMSQSLINENIAISQGGGLKHTKPPSAVATLENVTISRNNSNVGSAIFSDDNLLLTNVTVVRNIGNDVAFINNGTVTFKNTIFALNTYNNCSGDEQDFVSEGGNLDDGDTCNLSGVVDLVNTNPLIVGIEPADNGGPTYTYALQDSSPAIDAGNNDGCPSIDQRGYSRPLDGNGDGIAICDIGAYEAPLKIFMPVIYR